MLRRVFIHINAVLLAGPLSAYSAAQTLPRGYTIVQVTQNPGLEVFPRMNRHGQIVFTQRPENGGRPEQEIFLYDGRTGELTQITDNGVNDVGPDISDEGVICWSSGIGPLDPNFGEPTFEIMVRDPDGTVTRLTDNDVTDGSPTLNNRGTIAWKQYTGVACGLTTDIFMYDGQSIRAITSDSVSQRVAHQSVELNDLDELVWTRYDFCDPPFGFNFTSTIMLYSGGETFELTDGQSFPQIPDINNRSQALWTDFDTNIWHQVMDTWNSGVTTRLTDDGLGGSINDLGHVAFNRWDPVREASDVWLYRDDVFFRLTFDSFSNMNPSINVNGEVTWESGNFPTTDVRYMRRFAIGDLDCDGRIDAFDIEPFIFALFAQQEYLDRYPTCDPLLADTTGDGLVDAFDIEPFLEILFP